MKLHVSDMSLYREGFGDGFSGSACRYSALSYKKGYRDGIKAYKKRVVKYR